jgi:hypothetical protein
MQLLDKGDALPGQPLCCRANFARLARVALLVYLHANQTLVEVLNLSRRNERPERSKIERNSALRWHIAQYSINDIYL